MGGGSIAQACQACTWQLREHACMQTTPQQAAHVECCEEGGVVAEGAQHLYHVLVAGHAHRGRAVGRDVDLGPQRHVGNWHSHAA